MGLALRRPFCHQCPSVVSFCPLPPSLPPSHPSGLPHPHRLRAAVQFAPPGWSGRAAVAQRTVPVRGDFLVALAGLFVTERDVTVRRL